MSLCDRWLENPIINISALRNSFATSGLLIVFRSTAGVSRWGNNGLCAAAREFGRRRPHMSGKAGEFHPRHHRHHCAAKAIIVPTNVKLFSGGRVHLVRGEAARRRFAPVLRARRQDRADTPPALSAFQAIQTYQSDVEDFANGARPVDARYSPYEQRQR
jgi:hypothetical protein